MSIPENTPLAAEQVATLKKIATYQRLINIFILVNIVNYISFKFMPGGLAVLSYLLSLAVGLGSAVVAAMLAAAMWGVVAAVFTVPLMFVPCLNLITLLILNQTATSRLQKAGYKVGILGANPDDVR